MTNWTYSDAGRKRRVEGFRSEADQWIRGETQVLCCNEWLPCPNFTNTCDICAADYNMSGQRLAPREQWGEETGESVSDILSVDYTSTEALFNEEERTG